MNMPDTLIKLLEANTVRNISLGYDVICLLDIDNIEKEQVGYSVDSNGKSLITNKEGSWKADWLVIGVHDNDGDPYFVDISQGEFLVFTYPTMISDSYTNFIEILRGIQKLSVGRENPAAIKSNTVSDEETVNLISEIEVKNAKSEIWYWESLFD